MDPIKFFVRILPVIVVAGVVHFFVKSRPRQRIAVGWALVFPGAGHIYLGRRDRACAFGGIILALFLTGLILAEFRCVSPLDRHPLWGLAQVPGGLLTLVTALGTRSLLIVRDNPHYQVGCLYVGTACLLNILALCDVWDLSATAKKAPTA